MGKSTVRTALSVFAAALCSSVWYFPTLALAQQSALPTNDQLWNLRLIGADKALERGFTGRGFTIGIVDDIVQADHPEFTGRWLGGFDIGGQPYEVRETDFHGTHVAGIAAGANVGVARGASLVGINIFSDGASQSILSGYRFGLLNGVRAFNNSWGFEGSDGAVDTDDISREEIGLNHSDLLQAYRETANAGAIQVFATANSANPQPSWLAGLPYFYSELRSTWLAVMSVGPDSTRASYSNACGVAAQWCLAAPGGDFANGQPNSGVWSAWPGSQYNQIQGTSMAAPAVTGALAVASEVFPRASGAELVQLLLQSAKDLGATGVDDIYGWGLLNLDNVVRAADPITASAFANATLSRFAAMQHTGAAIPQAQFDGAFSAAGGQADDITTASVGLGNDGGSLSMQSATLQGVWTSGLYGHSTLERSANSTGAKSNTVGFLIGVDALSGPTYRAGAAAGLSRTNTDGAGDTSDADGNHLLLYGDWKQRGWFASGVAQMALFDQVVLRSNISGAEGASVQPVGRSSAASLATEASLRVGHGWRVQKVEVAPYLAATARRQESESFAETGAGIFSLSGPGSVQQQYEVGPGVRLTSTEWLSQSISVRGSLDLAYANLSGDRSFETSANLLGNAIVARADVGAHVFKVGSEVKVTGAAGRVSGVVSYNGRFQERATGHSVSAGLRAKF